MLMFERRRIVLFVLPAAVLALGLAASARAAAPPGASDAWIRWLPGNLPLAGYVTLTNSSSKALTLVSASSPAFKRIEFHHSVEKNGMSTMQPVDSVTIPAHGKFEFAPGGYHLMLWRKHSIQAGDRVAVTLHFSGGAALRVEFTVRGAAG